MRIERNIMKILLAAAILSALVLSSCKDDPVSNDVTPASNEVVIQGNKFTPSQITVSKGTTVTWVNKDSYAHTVTSTSQPAVFDSGNLGANQSFSFKFDSTGTFAYYCKIHPSMTGSVVVQ